MEIVRNLRRENLEKKINYYKKEETEKQKALSPLASYVLLHTFELLVNK